MKSYIKTMILFILLSCILLGYSITLKIKNSNIKNENIQLKYQLTESTKKIETESKLYDLRNIIDSQFHDILIHLYNQDVNYLNNKITENIIVSKNKITSNNKATNKIVEFKIPETKYIIRQRAYLLSDDKKEFHSIYEISSLNSKLGRYETLHVYFILDNGQWKLDFIGIDE